MQMRPNCNQSNLHHYISSTGSVFQGDKCDDELRNYQKEFRNECCQPGGTGKLIPTNNHFVISQREEHDVCRKDGTTITTTTTTTTAAADGKNEGNKAELNFSSYRSISNPEWSRTK